MTEAEKHVAQLLAFACYANGYGEPERGKKFTETADFIKQQAAELVGLRVNLHDMRTCHNQSFREAEQVKAENAVLKERLRLAGRMVNSLDAYETSRTRIARNSIEEDYKAGDIRRMRAAFKSALAAFRTAGEMETKP